MTHHTEVLNYIADQKGYKRYLEIGTQNGKNFEAIKCPWKTGVDPDTNAIATHHMTSDKFFEQNSQLFDLVFIDGLHTAEQVEKDFVNAMAYLAEGGIICLHDTNPAKEEMTKVPRVTKEWTGNVYQFIATLKFNSTCKFITLPFDYGITIIRKGGDIQDKRSIMTWEFFNDQKESILNIVTLEEFKTWINE